MTRIGIFPTLPSAASLVLAAVVVASTAWGAEPSPTYTLRSARTAGAVDQVTVQLEFSGTLQVSAPKEKQSEKARRNAASGECKLQFDERTLAVPDGAAQKWRSVRSYQAATAKLKIEKEQHESSLRPDRTLIVVHIEPPKVMLFSPRGTLTLQELDLIKTGGDSLVLEQLLPAEAVAAGYSWKPADKVVAALLGWDGVTHSEIESVLKEVTDTVARFEIAGRAEGTVNDVTSTIDLKAKYRFDRRAQRIDWMGLVVKEQRGVGAVEAGYDLLVRAQVRIVPKAESAALAEDALKGLAQEPTAELTQLFYESAQGGWRLTHDRRWCVNVDAPERAVVRLIDGGDDIAQCNLWPLPAASPEKLPSLEDFQEDVRKQLGKSFGEFVEASQSANGANYRVYRLAIRGKVEDVPSLWNYYLVADAGGRQAAFAFTLEEKFAERFAGADEKLVDAFRFAEPKVAAGQKK